MLHYLVLSNKAKLVRQVLEAGGADPNLMSTTGPFPPSIACLPAPAVVC